MGARPVAPSPSSLDGGPGATVPRTGGSTPIPARPLRDSSLFIPVPAAEPLVGSWRDRYDRTAPVGFPAHVTLLYPFLPPALIDEKVVSGLRRLFAAVPPFEFTLGGVCGFRNLVWLAPEPADAFAELTRRLRERYPELAPYGDSTRKVPPHLTVARSADVDFLQDVAAELVPELPISTVAEEVWLLAQSSPSWELHTRFPLRGDS